MVPRQLGRTGLGVTPIGFGAFKIGRNEKVKYPHAYELPSEQEVQRILASAIELGVNYIDTAPAYGVSEDRLGRLLPGTRDELVISTKVGEIFENGQSRYDFSAAAIQTSLENSLRRLRRGVLDIVFLHVSVEDLEVLHNTDAVSALQDARQSGKVRAIGHSAKSIEGAMDAMTWADVLMIEYNPNERSFEPVLRAAADAGVGVIVKKGLASGHLPAEQAIPFVLRNQAVTSMVIGTLNTDHLRQTVELASAALPAAESSQG